MSLEQRLSVAAKAGEKIHENYGSYIESGASVMWSRMNHMMGCGAHLPAEDKDKHIKVLRRPEKRHFMIGDQVFSSLRLARKRFGCDRICAQSFQSHARRGNIGL